MSFPAIPSPAVPPESAEVRDTHWGVEVPDPWRRLEDPEDPATRAWVEAQAARTRAVLDAVPRREALRERLSALYKSSSWGVPARRGEQLLVSWQAPDRAQPVLVVCGIDGGPASGRVFLDPSVEAGDDSVSLGEWSPSPDGQRVAWACSEGGSDWRIWRVRDVVSGLDLGEEVRWTKFTVPTWTRGASAERWGEGFFYGRYPTPSDPTDLRGTNRNQTLWFHRLGTAQAADVLVFARPDRPDWGFRPEVSRCGRYLIITVWFGSARRNRLLTASLEGGPEQVTFVDATPEGDAAWTHIGELEVDGGEPAMVLLTTAGAPRGRVVLLPIGGGEPIELVPEGEHTIVAAAMAGTTQSPRVAVHTLEHAVAALRLHPLDGGPPRTVVLPGLGSITALSGHEDSGNLFVGFTSLTTPPMVLSVLPDGSTSRWAESDAPFDGSGFVTEMVRVPSSDGVEVPAFLVRRADVAPDRDRPVLLYGYGGFNAPVTPVFQALRAVWLELGGLLAVANLRGGGEYGAKWHDAGRKLRKKQVFEDFEAIADFLVESGWTRPGRLAIQGRSNGGLLVGACLTRRPGAYGAALPGVGVLDMLRYHRFTVGWAWADDYGTAEDSEEMFRYLLSYSPLHNIEPGRSYPPTLISTAGRDDRVVPLHSFKFAAALQQAQGGPGPILLRVESRAGHGLGTAVELAVDQAADELAFLIAAMDL